MNCDCARAAVVGAAVLCAGGPALAGEAYLGVAGGASLRDDSGVESTPSFFVEDARYQTGWAARINAGYRVAVPGLDRLALRPELALAYRRNEIDRGRGVAAPTGTGVNTFNAGGTVHVLHGLANVWIDADLPGVALTPYLGGGAGPARVWVDDFRAEGSNMPIADDADTVFGYQLGGGASYPITETLSVTADYRYTALDATDMAHPGGREFAVELDAHQISLGLRYRF